MPQPDEFSDKELERYYRKEQHATEQAINAFLRDSRNPEMIVFGAKAVNAYLPDWLDKETKDWDILVAGDASDMAHKLEAKLDKRYGGDFFRVEPAVHPGTFRVRSNITGAVVADISIKDKTIGFRRIAGVNYALLEWLEEDAKKTLANPEAEYRRAKDKDTVRRIRVFKKLKRVRRGSTERYIDGSDASMGGINL